MASLFQHISQSANADLWERFRLPSMELDRLIDTARALGFSVRQPPYANDTGSFVQIDDAQRVLCIAEPSGLAPSPFHIDPEPFSVAFTDSAEAIREYRKWTAASEDELPVVLDADGVPAEFGAPLAVILRNEERAAWLSLEATVLRSMQTLNQLDLEAEPLFMTLSHTVHEMLAPDLLAIRMESPGDFWPGKTPEWVWVDARDDLTDVIPALTPRLQRLLYRRERSMFIEDILAAPDVLVNSDEQTPPLASSFLLPLICGAKSIGMLMLFYTRRLSPLPGETEAVEVVRHELSHLLDRSRTHLLMQRMATVDGLTNLFNHRFFRDQLRTEYQRALRYGKMMAVIMVDIDNFKSYNDTHGHLAGDRVLSETARTIKAAVRDIDFVARYGGEEFALILPEVDAGGGMVVAEKIRKAVEAQRFISEDGEAIGSITISCGVTDNTGANGPEELIARADRGLYWVKRHGRNRVRLSVAERDE
ncbi:MAG TPA: GGDEF domain-containing protein [bacterium]